MPRTDHRRPRPADGRAAPRRDERGAALIEAALVLPIIVVLLLGIIEFGLAFQSGAVTTGASRSGARMGAATYAPAGSTSSAQLAAADQMAAAVSADLKSLSNADPVGMVIYKVDPSSTSGAPYGGFPGDNLSGGCSSSCFRYTWNGSDMVYASGGWSDPDACGTSVDSLGVYVQAKHYYLTELIGESRFVNGKTVMRIEPLPTDQCSGSM